MYELTITKDNKIICKQITSEWYTAKLLKMNYENRGCEVAIEEIKSE